MSPPNIVLEVWDNLGHLQTKLTAGDYPNHKELAFLLLKITDADSIITVAKKYGHHLLFDKIIDISNLN